MSYGAATATVTAPGPIRDLSDPASAWQQGQAPGATT